MKDEKDVLMDHEYDGIHELDNKLPPWWLYLFYITIIWGVGYLLYYHVLGLGDSSYAEYMKEVDPNWTQTRVESGGFFSAYHSPFYSKEGDLTPLIRSELWAKKESAKPSPHKAEEVGTLENVSFEQLIQAAMQRADEPNLKKLQAAFPEIWASLDKGGAEPAAGESAEPAEPAESYTVYTDEKNLSEGQSIFKTNCVTCHGQNGEGGIGPNLTDNYWIHGAGINNMMHTIINGVPAKGMIAWGKILSMEQMQQVASYILTLHGTNPPNAKAPQGEEVEYPLQ